MAQASTAFPAALDTFVAADWDASIALAMNTVQAYDGPISPTAITVLGQTFPDSQATSNLQIANGTLYLSSMLLPANVTIKNFSVVISVQSTNDVVNSWMGLFDTAYKVLAVSANATAQTPAAGALWTLPVANCVANAGVAAGANTQFITSRAGLYYFGVMAKVTTTQPTLSTSLAVDANGRGAMVPYVAGASTTGATTPPSVTTVVAQTTPSTAGKGVLGYVS